MNDHKTSTQTLVSALRILAGEIQSDDGVANMTIAEAADRIEELVEYYGEALALERNRADQAEQRNAELVEQLKAYGKYAHDTTLEDRNAELVAALRDAREVLNEYSEDGTHRAARLASERIDKAIARVESATSGLRTGNPLADPVMGGLPRYDGGKLSTPAKHPDTELLEWLFCNTIIAGPDGHVIDCRDDADAARKQGGAT